MKRFNFITSEKILRSVYDSNGKIIQYVVSKDDFDALSVTDTLIIGHCENGNIFAEVVRKNCYPREQYAVDGEVYSYVITVKMMLDYELVLYKPCFNNIIEDEECYNE